jgi:hypothetical protein
MHDLASGVRKGNQPQNTRHQNERPKVNFGKTNDQHKWEDHQEHSFRGTGSRDEEVKIQDNAHHGATRKTGETDENLFEYSATNDRLHEEDFYGSRRNDLRQEDIDIHEYMHDQRTGHRSGFHKQESEGIKKLQSDIVFSKERPDTAASRPCAYDTASRLLSSKIIGHLTHHQGKVEQITEVSKRVPGSTLAHSRAAEEKPYQRQRQNESPPKRDSGEFRNRDQGVSYSRTRDWEGQQQHGSALQKYSPLT